MHAYICACVSGAVHPVLFSGWMSGDQHAASTCGGGWRAACPRVGHAEAGRQAVCEDSPSRLWTSAQNEPLPRRYEDGELAYRQEIRSLLYSVPLISILYWNVPCWGHQLWDINCCMCVCVCVCVSVSQSVSVSVRRHIAILRQEWFNGLPWNCVGMLGVTMPRMYQILVTNQLNFLH